MHFCFEKNLKMLILPKTERLGIVVLLFAIVQLGAHSLTLILDFKLLMIWPHDRDRDSQHFFLLQN